MQLSDYLRDEAITPAAFARQLKVTRAAVSRWLSGDRVPRIEFVREIEKVTSGRVTRHELRPDLFPPPEAAPAPATEAA